MQSSVGGLLHEPLSANAQSAIFVPWILASLAESIPLLTQANRAHLVSIRAVGLVSSADAAVLSRAISQLAEEGVSEICVDGALEDVYFNYEARLMAIAGREIGARLHVARSRNDLQATLDRLRARRIGLALAEGLLQLRGTLQREAPRYFDCVMPGYTHMQHAQPITFGFYLLGIDQALGRDTGRVLHALERINECPLGAGALAGTPYRLDRARTAELLGFAGPVAHTLDAVASKDALIELLAAATLAVTTIGRLAQDFYTMTTYEFGMLELPDRLAITSSLMPQKKNQAVLEFVKGRQSHLVGALSAALCAFHSKSFSHVLDANADSLHFLWGVLHGTASLLPVVGEFVAGAQPKRERMRALVDANFATATDFADYLMIQHALAFKDAHHVTGRIVRLALAEGLSAAAITTEMVARASKEVLGRELHMQESDIREAFDSERSISRRAGSGGPALADVQSLHQQATAEAMAMRREVQHLNDRIQAAASKLQVALTEL